MPTPGQSFIDRIYKHGFFFLTRDRHDVEEPTPGHRVQVVEDDILELLKRKQTKWIVGRMYAEEIIQGRWPEYEEILLDTLRMHAGTENVGELAQQAIYYCMKVIKGRWKEFEELLKSGTQDNAYAWLEYARDVLKRYCRNDEQFPGGEFHPSYYLWLAHDHPWIAIEHAIQVLDRRFDNPFVELLISLSKNYWDGINYAQHFAMTRDDLRREALIGIVKDFELEDFITYSGFLIEYCIYVLRGRYYDIEGLLREHNNLAYLLYEKYVIGDYWYDEFNSLAKLDYQAMVVSNPKRIETATR